jgi:hypothetical protein
MQENSKENGGSATAIEKLFLGAQESYRESQKRTEEESKVFQKTEFFRMDRFGVYRLRVLPVAPNRDGSIERKSYEYPVHQLSLELERPAGGERPSPMYVTVPRATDAGYSVDLIDTYRKLAVETAKAQGNDKLADKIAGGTFGGGLKFSYAHALYILDLNGRGKGIQLLTLSHPQFRDLEDKKFVLWQRELAKNSYAVCPVSSVYSACPVEIEKLRNGDRTEYHISIDEAAGNDALNLKELDALMTAPRIPEVITRYSRYQMEATVEFLKQCDKKYGMKLFETDEIQSAIKKLYRELPQTDKSSFSFERRTKGASPNGAVAAEPDLDDLLNRLDELNTKGLDDKTEEGQELRTQIRTYIERENLPVRITRTTSNGEILAMIEEFLQKQEKEKGGSEDDLPF